MHYLRELIDGLVSCARARSLALGGTGPLNTQGIALLILMPDPAYIAYMRKKSYYAE